MTTSEKLKQVLIDGLNLEDIDPEEIDETGELFGQGLGLDSLDAVELVVLIKKHFGVDIKNMEEAQPAFKTFQTLVDFIDQRQTP